MAINTTGADLVTGVKRYVPEMQSSGHDDTILAFINNERRFLLSMKQVQSEEVHLTSATDDIVADQSHIDLRGVPDTSITDGLRADYWYLPDDWTTSTTVPQVWELFREVLEVGSALRAGIRREDRRAELERHYDGRLLPNFARNFGRRVAEAQEMGDIRTTWRSSLGSGGFGRTR
jgi:hypothetical protein